MNLFKTFESRIGDALGATPQGSAVPISVKRLCKRARHEMEAETFIIDDVDTAPALYTVLVSPEDDVFMRKLYASLAEEVADSVKDAAEAKGYVFVGEPLVRFMADFEIKEGKFAVFAENVDAVTLERLREEERAFLSNVAAQPAHVASVRSERRPAARPAASRPAAVESSDDVAIPGLKPLPDIVAPPSTPVVQPAAAPSSTSVEDSAAGLDVVPLDYLDDQLVPPYDQSLSIPLVEDGPAASSAAAGIAGTPGLLTAMCTLIDHQTGCNYRATAPSTIIGRERKAGNVVLRDPNVSRVHAELSFDGTSWHITDLGSTNGTMVNSRDVKTTILHDGDLITVGLMNLEFRES